jgi:hypothetical protein
LLPPEGQQLGVGGEDFRYGLSQGSQGSSKWKLNT